MIRRLSRRKGGQPGIVSPHTFLRKWLDKSVGKRTIKFVVGTDEWSVGRTLLDGTSKFFVLTILFFILRPLVLTSPRGCSIREERMRKKQG